MNIFDLYGFPVNPGDMQALSESEISEIQYANAVRMQNANQAQANVLGAVNAFRPADKPLGERFADFKVRLAVAIEYRRVR